MPEEKKDTITIIGAGIVGCFLAILFAKRGYKVHIYERFSKDEISSSNTKRSFNLTFYDFGISALKEAGLWEIVEPTLVKVKGAQIQVADNPPINRFIPIKHPQFVIQRGLLINTLIQEATTYPGVTFHFETALVSVNRQDKTILTQDLVTNEHKTTHCDIILGADGVNSSVRAFIQQGQETSHRQEYPDWVYKQISFSPEEAQKLNLEHNVIYTWSRKHGSLLAHPNKDKSFSALLILPKGPMKGFATLTSEAAIEKFFKENFSDLLPVLPTITVDILGNPVAQFVSIYTNPWYYKDFMVLLGDAAHGFLPFYGQGISAGFGDCLKLMKHIDTYQNDWEKIFSSYQQSRKPHMDALANLSKETLRIYVRHTKADYELIYKKFESLLSEMWPTMFLAPTTMRVAFNPDETADYVREHKSQRRLSNILGIPLLILATTAVIGLHERIEKFIKRLTI